MSGFPEISAEKVPEQTRPRRGADSCLIETEAHRRFSAGFH